MEIILAIVVASAVIFFGALISMGNERQRKAIDELREQMFAWAIQDLRIKRESLVRTIRVDDPIIWLNAIASRICGRKLDLDMVDTLEGLNAIICVNKDLDEKIGFSFHSPRDVRKLIREKRSKLSQFGKIKEHISLLQDGRASEVSVLNGGIMFDLELPIAWKKLTGQDVANEDRVWMYIHSSNTI